MTGNGFLYNMVRIIAGSLLDIGRGRIPQSAFQDAIESGNREVLGVTAPALGLSLRSVEYENLPVWPKEKAFGK